jgi:hypothetical protein
VGRDGEVLEAGSGGVVDGTTFILSPALGLLCGDIFGIPTASIGEEEISGKYPIFKPCSGACPLPLFNMERRGDV